MRTVPDAVLVSIMALLLVTGCARATEGRTAEVPVRWELASIVPAGNFAAHWTEVFSERVAEATGGDVTISVHLSGSLGLKGPEMLNAVRDGLVHMADIQMNQQVGEDTLFGIESTACLAGDFGELSRLQRLTRPMFDRLAAEYNQKILYLYPLPRQILFADRPTDASLAQYAGLNVRTIDRNGVDFFRRLGAVPRLMPWPDVVAALSTHALDGVSTSAPTAVDGSFWEFLGHGTLLHWQMNSFMVTVNLDAWDRIPAPHRSAIELVARDVEVRLREASIEAEADSLATLRGNGMTIVEPGPGLREEIQAVCGDIWRETLATEKSQAVAILESYRSAGP